MVDKLKALIIHQLKDVFNNIRVYDEPVKQGLTTPAFQLLIIDTHGERLMAKYSSRSYSFNINYYPDTEDKRNECDEILDQFITEFKYIADQHHVHEIDGTVSDDVLVITFDVKVLLREVEDGITMQELGGVSVDEKN